MKKPSVLFLVPYPLKKAPSQRFRVELFFDTMTEAGIQFKISPFLDEKTWDVLYKKGLLFKKSWGIFTGFLKRWVDVFRAIRYDFVFIHREAAPIGPPIFEWVLVKLFRKKIIYDFDDAIWIPNTTRANKFANGLKCFWKVKHICKWAYKITAGNQYLCDYARQYNVNVVYLPTVVDTDDRHNRVKHHAEVLPVVGWTGSHSTLKYLNEIVPILQELEKSQVNFVVISDKAPGIQLQGLVFIPWKEESEVDDLLKLDIGLMPLENDKWSEGKCGFKLIQYLSLGIPAIASPVGVNKTIIENDVNGYLCSSANEWESALKKLLANPALREQMGKKGREKILRDYSLASQREKFIQLFA